MRGDVGFFSGTKKLLDALDGYDVTLLSGISSIPVFAAKIKTSWDDAALISLHGRDANLIHTVSGSRKVFALTGGENTVDVICKKLYEYGFGELPVIVGERLSYPDEKITRGCAADFIEKTFDSLAVLYLENKTAVCRHRHGIPD